MVNLSEQLILIPCVCNSRDAHLRKYGVVYRVLMEEKRNYCFVCSEEIKELIRKGYLLKIVKGKTTCPVCEEKGEFKEKYLDKKINLSRRILFG